MRDEAKKKGCDGMGREVRHQLQWGVKRIDMYGRYKKTTYKAEGNGGWEKKAIERGSPCGLLRSAVEHLTGLEVGRVQLSLIRCWQVTLSSLFHISVWMHQRGLFFPSRLVTRDALGEKRSALPAAAGIYPTQAFAASRRVAVPFLGLHYVPFPYISSPFLAPIPFLSTKDPGNSHHRYLFLP